MFLPLPSDRLAERIARCITGLAVFGFGISMFITADLGVAPWDVFHIGLGEQAGISTGLAIELTGVVILLLWLPLRERVGLGTLLNAIEIGLVVLVIGDRLPTSPLLVVRSAYLVGGLVAIAVGSGLYIGAGLGSGPRDGLMLGLAKRGISLRLTRTGIEVAVLIAGLLLGGSFGVGTVLFTFGIGPMVQFFLPRLRVRNDPTVFAAAH